jgi:hypothetical protein
MNRLTIILAINLAILLAYSIGLRMKYGHGSGLDIAFASATYITIHIVVNVFIGGIVANFGQKELGKNFYLAAAVTLLVGFGVCLGNWLM